MRGRMILRSGIPAAFMESSSYFSPKLPNVINAANRMANGRDRGIKVKPDKKKNWAKTPISSPLPTNSSTYLHRNCIIKMNRQIKNVPEKSNRKLFRIKMSIFLRRSFMLIYNMFLICKISIKIWRVKHVLSIFKNLKPTNPF